MLHISELYQIMNYNINKIISLNIKYKYLNIIKTYKNIIG